MSWAEYNIKHPEIISSHTIHDVDFAVHYAAKKVNQDISYVTIH